MKSAEEWIKDLDLKPHPEGGFYKEIYRSEGKIDKSHLPNRYAGARNFATSIYFLLRSEDFSAFHKIQSDELWFYHAGSAVEILILDEKGLISVKLGADVANGEVLQAIIPRQKWFAAKVITKASYVLVSCVVAPGFDFADFDLADRSELLTLFPLFKEKIIAFTKS